VQFPLFVLFNLCIHSDMIAMNECPLQAPLRHTTASAGCIAQTGVDGAWWSSEVVADDCRKFIHQNNAHATLTNVFIGPFVVHHVVYGRRAR